MMWGCERYPVHAYLVKPCEQKKNKAVFKLEVAGLFLGGLYIYIYILHAA